MVKKQDNPMSGLIGKALKEVDAVLAEKKNKNALAANLRKQGVNLPNIRRTFVETINVDQLNKLIREKFGN